MTVPLLVLAAAALLWAPHRPAASRLRRLFGGARRSPPRASMPLAAGAAVGLVVGVLAHPVAGLAAAPAGWLAVRRLRRERAPTGGGTAGGFDLLAACLAAGMPVPAAVRAVAGHFPPHIARALTDTADLLALGAEPGEAWAAVAAWPDTAPLARGASRSARSGTALADLARGLARRAREQAADAVEARAQRAAVLIAGPLGLCFLPAFLCLGVAPVVVGLATNLL